MYAFRSLFDKHPNIISAAVMAWVNLAVIAGTVEISAETVAGLNIALVSTLGLFVAAKTANKAVLGELAEEPPALDGVPLAPATEVTKKPRTRRST